MIMLLGVRLHLMTSSCAGVYSWGIASPTAASAAAESRDLIMVEERGVVVEERGVVASIQSWNLRHCSAGPGQGLYRHLYSNTGQVQGHQISETIESITNTV